MHDTDKETERWWITGLAERYREKWEIDPDAEPQPCLTGYARRSKLDLYDIGNKLADIQAEYELRTEYFPRDLYMRTLMMIWPVLMPYKWPPRHTTKSRKILKARDQAQIALFYFFNMVNKQAPASSVFDYPRITISHRTTRERTNKAQSRDTQRRKENRSEIIGHAVLQDYLNHPPGRRSLESSFAAISACDSIDGVPTNSPRSVRDNYHAFRKLAFERGYADSRAFWNHVEAKPWPDDQIWLEDFPPIST